MYPEGINKDESMAFSMLTIDYNFLETFGMKMVQGRGFSKDFKSDGNEAFILNETAAKKLGWNSPIGKKMYWPVGNTKNGQVVGVVEDFHFKSFHNRIEPLVMQILPDWFSYITVKIRHDQIPETISFLEKKFKEFIHDQPFEYFFLDRHFDQMYKSEQRLSSLFDYFTLTAIFIACLGLFGISVLMIEQRTKEIGIRKVLGASITSIVFILTKEFILWVVIANIIAWPIGWLAMNKWLQDFAYRIDLTMWPFLLAGLSAIIIVLLTVCWQAVKAAAENPIENLRYE
jgi:putative ABC transport system permease protein